MYFFGKQNKAFSGKMSTKNRNKLSIKNKYDLITKLFDQQLVDIRLLIIEYTYKTLKQIKTSDFLPNVCIELRKK